MKLIVNADDFGYTESITAGILRAHRDGIVTATTLMTSAPDTRGAATLARATPSLDVGVHLVVTFDRPTGDVARCRSLVDKHGRFFRPKELMSRDIVPEEALAEYRAQYNKARELLGREPTHVDSHHWVHDHPALEWAIGELARETGAAARIHSSEQRDRLRARGVRSPDHFAREFQYEGKVGVDSLLALLERIARQTGVTELMCHPGEPDEGLAKRSGYARERETELATLTDPRVRAAVKDLGVTLATFAAV
ncbi:MAG: ChbG/HpnK family deacetylase [Chloroflexota bacterium]|nr:ChbG/HpnK family deacetylase [Chloroflexota bacterium]